jgi:hypothetical protein
MKEKMYESVFKTDKELSKKVKLQETDIPQEYLENLGALIVHAIDGFEVPGEDPVTPITTEIKETLESYFNEAKESGINAEQQALLQDAIYNFLQMLGDKIANMTLDIENEEDFGEEFEDEDYVETPDINPAGERF